MSTTSNTAATIDSKKPNTKQELIAANIKLLIRAVGGRTLRRPRQLPHCMSRFHNYNFGNVLEIARQMPTATRVAGFWTWKSLGRSVNAGAKGIRILAPIVGVSRKKDEEAGRTNCCTWPNAAETIRETEAEAVAFVVGEAVGLAMGSASANYIHLYHGNASLLTESFQVIQLTASFILAALERPSRVARSSPPMQNPNSRRYRNADPPRHS